MNEYTSVIENLADFFKSPFVVWLKDFLGNGFVSACAGAFAGAAASGYIARRAERNARLEKRLIATNSATAMSLSILNNAIGFKKQFAAEIVSNFKSSKKKVENGLAELALGIFEHEFIPMDADFNTVQMFHFEPDVVEKLILTEVGAVGRISNASSFLVQSLHGLANAVESRNLQIAVLCELSTNVDANTFARRYFGFQDDDGFIDARLSDAIESIEIQLDDTIHYALFLAKELSKLSKELFTKLGDASMPGTQFQVSDEIKEFLPPPENHPEFEI